MATEMSAGPGDQDAASTSSDPLFPVVEKEAAFCEFYDEVKAIEKRDSVLTSKQQIDRLTRPGATYFNLNPYDVLQIDPDTPLSDVKKKYRQMSILVHPDKNQDDSDRAQKSFEDICLPKGTMRLVFLPDCRAGGLPLCMALEGVTVPRSSAINKAYKTLENEEGLKRCKEIVEEAKTRTDEMIRLKKKQLKKEGKPQDVPEDDLEKYKHAIYVQTCKLFADLERLRQERETKDMHERKRKAEEEAVEEEKKKMEKEWQKNFEESRSGRVDSWRSWNKKHAKKSSKGNLKPPKLKAEKR